jgi:hypothetical protein
MTMPDERMRAVRWGAELLDQMVIDDSLPEAAIAAAKRIGLTYPTAQALEGRLQSGAIGLPPDWTAALLDACEFFDKLRIGALGSKRTRSELQYTLRHFPDERTIRAMARTPQLGEWLRPDRGGSK